MFGFHESWWQLPEQRVSITSTDVVADAVADDRTEYRGGDNQTQRHLALESEHTS